ncbi:MAG: RNA polymerase sigma-70 factor [Tannerellaceae bacterium]|nr:RNA polymerase sigma-70 factor [Tannerellaceae bacterium]
MEWREFCYENFNIFYRRHYRKCFLFAKSYVHDDWVAEDIASESLLKLWETAKLKNIEHPMALLFSILRNKSLDHLKHEVIKQETLSALSANGQRELNIRISTLEACDPNQMFSTEIQGIIESTLNALPEQTRKIFMMSRFENLSRQEIADALGITKKGVEYHIAKALKSLQADLKDYLSLFYFLLFYN